MPLTLEDIAKICGVSRSTVSRVINEEQNVSPKTREQVLAVIQQINFQPNLAARGLAMGKTRVLGLVIPMGVSALFTDPFFPLLIQGISSSCNTCDYSVMLWVDEPDYERRTLRQILYNGLVDGVIITSMLIDDPLTIALSEGKLPYLMIGRHPTNQNVNYVDIDNFNGSRQAVHHLMQLGRQRIATIAGPHNMIAGMDRYRGYQAALREKNVEFNPALTVEANFTEEGGYHAMQRLLCQKPDAVFAASDIMAIGAMRALKEAGLRIPQDVAVIGFDDIPQARVNSPALTTVRQPIQRVGGMAAETLVDIIEHPESQPRHIILPAELVIRGTCGAI